MKGTREVMSVFAACVAEKLRNAESTQQVNEIIADISEIVAEQARQENWTPIDYQNFWNEFRSHLTRLPDAPDSDAG